MSSEVALKILFVGNVGVGKKTLIDMILGLKSLPFPPGKSPPSVIKKGDFPSSTGNRNAMLLSVTPDIIKSGKQNQIIQNSNLIIFVSTEFRDMLVCKQLIPELQDLCPNAEFCVIANKQDAEKSLNPNAAMKFFELPTIGISAIMPEHRDALIQFINEFIK